MMAHSGRFGAVVTAMVTPFDEGGALDLDGAATLARWLADHGSDALVVAGSTGESMSLSDTEKTDLWRAVAHAVTVPVIASSGTADTAHSIQLSQTAEEAGAAALLVVAPYYNRPHQAGLEGHFRAVAGVTELPVLIYDIPVRTGRRVDTDTVLALARGVPNIVGVKDASGDLAGAARMMAEAPGGFEVYSGDDAMTLPLLALGAVGVISVAAHWGGETFAGMTSNFAKGDTDAARECNARLLESYPFQSMLDAPNPMPAKAMCRVMGLPVGHCRPPLTPEPADLEERARAVLGRLGAGGG